MPTYKINNEELEFEYIYYCDSVNGNDSRDGLTEATSLKTIQAAINKVAINTNSAIVLLPNSLFTGVVYGTGFINISANKQITFIGQLLNNDINTIPIIRSTDSNCIQNLSVKEINFINIRIDSLGSTSTGGNGAYALLLYMAIASSTVNFYNCYLKPRGVMFFYTSVTNITVNVYNSIIDYDAHGFAYEVFYSPLTVNVYNTVVLGIMSCRTTYGVTGVFYNSIVPSTNLSYHNFTSTTNKRLETSLSTINSELQVALDTSYYINQGTGINPNGTTANIGIYGGPYAFGDWSNKYFFFDNGLYKTYDVENETWITPIGSNTPTPEDYETYGMSSLEDVDFTTLTNPNNIVIKKYTTDLDEASILNVIGVIAKPNKLIFPLSNIDESILENKLINFITVNAITSGNGVVKTILSFDNGATWWGYSASSEQFINVVDLTEESNYLDVADYGITPTVLASIPSTQIEQLRGVDYKHKKNTLRVAYYISAPDIYSVASVDSISINTSEKGNWEGSVVNTDYTYYHATNKIVVKLLNSGSYKVNYFPEDVAMKVEADAIENAGIDSWNDLKDKPLFFPAEEHIHDIPNIEGLSNIILNLSNTWHTHTELHNHSNLDILDKISYINNKPYFNNVLWPGAEDRPGNTFVSLLDTPESYEDTTEEFIKVKSDASGLEYAHITYSVPVTNVSIKNKHAKRYSFIFGGG